MQHVCMCVCCYITTYTDMYNTAKGEKNLHDQKMAIGLWRKKITKRLESK